MIDLWERFRGKAPSAFDAEATPEKLKGRTLVVGIGSMKSGTTWLSEYLKDHPEFYHSPIKEVNHFNTMFDNPQQSSGPALRHERMETIAMRLEAGKVPNDNDVQRLRDLAEIGQMKGDDERYLTFFARRIGEEPFFGEISPSYSLLPAEGYAHIAALQPQSKLMFLMRDPVKRAISNIQHRMRRRDVVVDTEIELLRTGHMVYEQSNYMRTLRSVEEGAPTTPFLPIVYEDMFNDATVRSICDFIGLTYREADFERRVNVARAEPFSEDQVARIRERLEPIYREMAAYFGDERPRKWLWT